MKLTKAQQTKYNKAIPSEYIEQKQCVSYLKRNHIFFWSVPNEAQREMGTMVKLQQTGLKKGVVDLHIMLKNKMVFIEMKRQHKIKLSGVLSSGLNGLSAEQEGFLDKVNKYPYSLGFQCNGFVEFEALMDELIATHN